jgi:hypothetical protein
MKGLWCALMMLACWAPPLRAQESAAVPADHLEAPDHEGDRVPLGVAQAVAADVRAARGDVMGPLGFFPWGSVAAATLAGWLAPRAEEEATTTLHSPAVSTGAALAGAGAAEGTAVLGVVLCALVVGSVGVPIYAALVVVADNWATGAGRPGGISIPLTHLLVFMAGITFLQALWFCFVLGVVHVPSLLALLVRGPVADEAAGFGARTRVQPRRTAAWSGPAWWGLLAFSLSGAWGRTAAWSLIPVVGPWLTWWLVRPAVQERVTQAHAVAHRKPHPWTGRVLNAWMISRAATLSVFQASFLAVAVLQAAGAVMAATAGLLLMTSLPSTAALPPLVLAELLLLVPSLAPPLMALALVGFLVEQGVSLPLVSLVLAASASE